MKDREILREKWMNKERVVCVCVCLLVRLFERERERDRERVLQFANERSTEVK